MFSFLTKIFGTANDRLIKKYTAEVLKINAYEDKIAGLSDEMLKAKTLELREKLKNGASLEEIRHEAFAVTREAAKRVLGQRHYDVQLISGLIMDRGNIAEMRTGEGKTLSSTLPAYLNALLGKGVHIVTVNDYLAKRDSEWMGKVFEFLGLSVGCITSGTSDDKRSAAYNCDITYATNNELGFDFLRDNMKFSLDAKVQRGLNYAIIDEVDSILIDEARTPLIISGPVDDRTDLYFHINTIVKQCTEEDYEKDEKTRSINLTEIGINKMEKILTETSLIKPDTSLYDFENLNLVHYINQALRARFLFTRDVDYIIKDGQVMIIDEFTGRIMEGRRYSDGLHQSIEAKERVEIRNENQTLASITFQNYFRMYNKLSGMTGTAMTEAGEFKAIYNLDVVSVPTHNPMSRIDHEDQIYGSMKEKYDAILALAKERNEMGQPILVGTASIEKSEEISTIFTKAGIKHKVLNAKFHEDEAHIIAQAGRYGAVTIATNMAGRGTDIMLGGNLEMMVLEIDKTKLSATEYNNKIEEIKTKIEDEKFKIKNLGGLCIIGTERHESRRIDNQLRGRSGRQGDPGETRFFLSLEDDLMRIFASDRISGILRTLGLKNGEAIQHPMISRSLAKAQQKVEMNNYEIRKNLLKFDDVMNQQRKIIYEQRSEVISSKTLEDFVLGMTEDLVTETVKKYIPKNSLREEWDLELLVSEYNKISFCDLTIQDIKEIPGAEEEITKYLISCINDLWNHKIQNYGSEIMNDATRYILLSTIDQLWKEHLHNLDHLRQGISFRAYGQKDPLSEYKNEAFVLFSMMLEQVRRLFVERICHLHIDLGQVDRRAMNIANKELQKMYESREDPAFFKKYNKGVALEAQAKPFKSHVAPEDRDPNNQETWGKISRNEPCPCGSGKKYKYCHGAD